MEVNGKVIQVLELQSGQGKNGEWRRQEFIVDITEGKWTKHLALQMWGDKIVPLNVGDTINAQVGAKSREYNGRWYTDLTVVSIVRSEAAPAPKPTGITASDMDDGLPF